MHDTSRLLLAAMAAALVLAAGTTASARNLSVSSREFSFVWSALEFSAGVGTVRCPVTLSGSFHGRTFAKTGILMGAITGATLTNPSCTGGSATILTATLPWHLRYNNFTGTLPRITGIGLVLPETSMQVNIGGTACLFRSDFTEPSGGPLAVDSTTGVVDSFTLSPEFELDLEDDRFLCALAGDANYSGTTTSVSTSSAGGHTIDSTPGGEIALDSLDAITFTGGELRMTCEWTLSGSLRTEAITVTEGATIGSVSSATADHCGGGSVGSVLGTPWNVKYVRATGTLPSSVTAVTLKVEGYAVSLRTFGTNLNCLYRGDLTGTLELSGVNPYPTGLWRLSEPRLTLSSGGGGCPASIVATGTYWLGDEQELRFVATGGGEAITVRLI